MSGQIIGPIGVLPSAVAAALAIDGTPQEAQSSTGTTVVTISTTATNTVVIAYVLINAGSGSTVTSPSLSWTKRASGGFGGTNLIEEWSAQSAGVLTGEVITSTHGSFFCSMIAFAVKNAHTAAPFDGSPVITSLSSSDPASIVTTNANTMLIGGFRMNTQASPTPGAGFTGLALNSDFILAEYQIISSSGSNSVTIGTGATDSTGSILDAIVQGP